MESAAGLALALGLVASASAARADDDDAVCGDRPGKAFANCTVPQGHFQLETDLYDQSWMKARGQDTTVTFYSNPTFKYGVSEKIDIEAAITPYQTTRVRDLATGRSTTQRGAGDLTIEGKYAVTKEITVMPFVTAPTAGGDQGAGGWGGGVRAPMQFKLPVKGWSVSLMPELDAVHDEAGDGAHFAHVEVFDLNKDVGHGVTLTGEVWGRWDYDPSGRTTQASVDLMAAWVPPQLKTVQFDVEVDVGLNHATPDTQWIVGLTKRF